jgi:hypothetical protein
MSKRAGAVKRPSPTEEVPSITVKTKRVIVGGTTEPRRSRKKKVVEEQPQHKVELNLTSDDYVNYKPTLKFTPLYQIEILDLFENFIPEEEAMYKVKIQKKPIDFLERIHKRFKVNSLKLIQYLNMYIIVTDYFYMEPFKTFINSFSKYNFDHEYEEYMENMVEKSRFGNNVIIDTNLIVRYDFVVIGRENKKKCLTTREYHMSEPLLASDIEFCKQEGFKYLGEGSVEEEEPDVEEIEYDYDQIIQQDVEVLQQDLALLAVRSQAKKLPLVVDKKDESIEQQTTPSESTNNSTNNNSSNSSNSNNTSKKTGTKSTKKRIVLNTLADDHFKLSFDKRR